MGELSDSAALGTERGFPLDVAESGTSWSS